MSSDAWMAMITFTVILFLFSHYLEIICNGLIEHKKMSSFSNLCCVYAHVYSMLKCNKFVANLLFIDFASCLDINNLLKIMGTISKVSVLSSCLLVDNHLSRFKLKVLKYLFILHND